MKEKLKHIISDIEQLSGNSETIEKEFLNQLNDFFEKKWEEKYVELYLKRERKISEICKEYKISPKRLYKIIKRKGIEPKVYKITKKSNTTLKTKKAKKTKK